MLQPHEPVLVYFISAFHLSFKVFLLIFGLLHGLLNLVDLLLGDFLGLVASVLFLLRNEFF